MQGEGWIREVLLLDGGTAAHVRCAAELTPMPGQYVLAHAAGSDTALATALFAARNLPDGFLTAPPIGSTWTPGTRLHLRGPLGHGFAVPASARRIALVAFRGSPRTLLSLLGAAFQQDASVALVSAEIPDDLPLQVEAHSLHAISDVCRWADYIALDTSRESLPELKAIFQADRTLVKAEAQILIRTPMPCGALAACGVCAVEAGREMLLACDDGPVFDFRQLMGWSSRA